MCPVGNLVGEENQGWTYAKSLLFDERAFLGAEAPALKRYLAKIRRYASQARAGGRPLIEDPSFARRLAEFELEVLAIDMTVQRVLHQGLGEGAQAMAIGSILKVRGSEMHQRLTELLVEVIGDYGPVYYADPNEDYTLRDAIATGSGLRAGPRCGARVPTRLLDLRRHRRDPAQHHREVDVQSLMRGVS